MKEIIDVGKPNSVFEADEIVRLHPDATHIRIFGFVFPIKK